MCSVLLVPLPLASVVDQLLSAANLRDRSVVCFSRKGVKRRSFQVLWLFVTPCLLISCGKLRFDGDCRFFFFFLTFHLVLPSLSFHIAKDIEVQSFVF